MYLKPPENASLRKMALFLESFLNMNKYNRHLCIMTTIKSQWWSFFFRQHNNWQRSQHSEKATHTLQKVSFPSTKQKACICIINSMTLVHQKLQGSGWTTHMACHCTHIFFSQVSSGVWFLMLRGNSMRSRSLIALGLTQRSSQGGCWNRRQRFTWRVWSYLQNNLMPIPKAHCR